MPAFCHFYGYTPAQYYDMTLEDTALLLRYMREFQKAANQR